MAAITNDFSERLSERFVPASRAGRALERTGGGFLAIYVVSFAVFLLVAIVAQLLTLRWRRWWPGAESETSLIGSVKASVYTFMSYLT